MTLEELCTKTLREADRLLKRGEITPDQAREYVRLWNAGPHFTVAKVQGYSIVNTNPPEED